MNFIATDFIHGKNFNIGQFCIIEDSVVVGDNVTIKNYVEIRKGTVIGDNCFVDSRVISSGFNRIGNNVTIRYNVILAKGVTVEDNVFIAPNVMTEYSKATGETFSDTVIGCNSFIGTASVIGPGVKIAKDCIIGEMSLVKSDCEAKSVYCGVPAVRTRENIR